MFKVYSGILYPIRAKTQLWKGTTQCQAHFYKIGFEKYAWNHVIPFLLCLYGYRILL